MLTSRSPARIVNKRSVHGRRKAACGKCMADVGRRHRPQGERLYTFGLCFTAHVDSRQSESEAATAAMYPGRGENSLCVRLADLLALCCPDQTLLPSAFRRASLTTHDLRKLASRSSGSVAASVRASS